MPRVCMEMSEVELHQTPLVYCSRVKMTTHHKIPVSLFIELHAETINVDDKPGLLGHDLKMFKRAMIE